MPHMDDSIYEIKQDVKDIKGSLVDIKVTLARNTDSLEHHIKRTNLLESKVEHVDQHIIVLNGVVRILLLAASFITGLWGLVQIYAFLIK